MNSISPIAVDSDLHFELICRCLIYMYTIHIFGIVFFWAILYTNHHVDCLGL